ncbi:HAMP domain-containing protein [Nonomuraea turkmeniaca]|uniref:histidine kinase n=1 Tax=Nonomuraea turkmeniaca TaxID=103838 RepID=A0A5S4F1F6_9ACTN|nr:ATP-binding protein [Nonomuraea turkmeniaca]TMR09785.1 HAMP domain-containing protein [Nonomuraea turkmeniaca]
MKRFFPRSIRARLTVIATLVAALVFTATSTITLATVPSSMRGLVHTRVELAVRRVASQAQTGQLPATFEIPSQVHLVQVVSRTGKVLAATPDLHGDPPLLTIEGAQQPGKIYVTESMLPPHVVKDEGQHLIMAMPVNTPQGLVTVYGAASLDEVNKALTWLYLLVFLGTPLVLLIVASTTWAVVGFALRPVERIRAEMAEITGQDLSRRVPVPDTGDEITSLAATTNDTLDRLERSAETQRRFVADASHELRSPISALRAQLEFANAYPEETDWPATGAHALAATDRLTYIIDELLMLAKLDAGAVVQRRVVDMCQMAAEQVRRRERSRVPIVLAPCHPAPVHGSPMQLDRLLTNLLDNATRHAATMIDLSVTVEEDKVIVTVTDDGEGIPPEHRERVFERFTRLESARAKDKGGSGLGLPLSREIAAAHGGSLTIAEHSPGARFVAVLPLYEGAPKSPHQER